MTNDMTKKTFHAQLIAQWITSLAITVICCAVLFVVFAGYIVDLHEITNLQTVKLELLLERYNQLQNELAVVKRAPLVQINGMTGTPTIQMVPSVVTPSVPVDVPPSTSPDGMQLPDLDQPVENETKETQTPPPQPVKTLVSPSKKR